MSVENPDTPEHNAQQSQDRIRRYTNDLVRIDSYASWMLSFRDYVLAEFEYDQLELDELISSARAGSASRLPSEDDFVIEPQDGLDKARVHLLTEIVPMYDRKIIDQSMLPDGDIDIQAYCEWYNHVLKSVYGGENNRHDRDFCQPAMATDTNECDWTALCPLKVVVRQFEVALRSYVLPEEQLDFIQSMQGAAYKYVQNESTRLRCQLVTMQARSIVSSEYVKDRNIAILAGRESMLALLKTSSDDSLETANDSDDDR